VKNTPNENQCRKLGDELRDATYFREKVLKPRAKGLEGGEEKYERNDIGKK